MTHRTPHETGFYWGRWHTPAPGTDDDGDSCTGKEWEVVQVFRNGLGYEDEDEFRVFVLGVAKAQPLGNFEWGPRVPDFDHGAR